MNENLTIVFGLLGGLSLFLFGMNSMSSALQKAAGEKMRRILGILTKNPIMGALAGMLVTAVLQSSSATTVMVIGFVSAGLMTLPQAISVIFGANIGTTITAQLLAFELSDYIYPIIFVGFMMTFIIKKERVKSIGMVLFSFGLLFEGIEIMGGVMEPLASSDFFTDLMTQVKDVPILGVGLGIVMTLVVQSSSATVAILQNFASQAGPDGVTSIMGLTGAIPILLGNNIGTTITALLACIGQSKDAKRTAVAHSVFNISGSILFLFLIKPLATFVQWISPTGDEVEVISRQIANAHTLFNVVCMLIWLPLLPVMVKIVNFIIRGDDNQALSEGIPKFLDDKLLKQPSAAMYLVMQELLRISGYMGEMLTSLKNAVGGNKSKTAYEDFENKQSIVVKLQESVSNYITKLISNGYVTKSQAEQAAGLLFINNNISRMAEESKNIMELFRKNSKKFSKDAAKDLEGSVDTVCEMFNTALDVIQNRSFESMERLKKKKKTFNGGKSLKKAHLQRVKKGQCDASLTTDYNSIIYEINRATDNCVNIAEDVFNGAHFADFGFESTDKTVVTVKEIKS